MKKDKCFDCGKIKLLTKHSLKGAHKPPYLWVCRACHDVRHEMPSYKYAGKKYQPGTPKWKKKKQ